MKKLFVFIVCLFALVACSDGGVPANNSTSIEAELKSNGNWPYQIQGVLDIVEAGGYEDTEYPGWAVGGLVREGDEFGVSISIGEGVVAAAGIDIDSRKLVTVWLGAPKKEFGVLTYPVERISSN
ncbi:hypothetical protein SAMN02745866_04078 [Alteromonadaceae bacterium Bs31]|nr:hypothetical protein SAMN02745866_04078 [Alteromonadaceae bacterium Bs31]